MAMYNANSFLLRNSNAAITLPQRTIGPSLIIGSSVLLEIAAHPQKIAQLIETTRMTTPSIFAGLAFIFHPSKLCKHCQNLDLREAFQLLVHRRRLSRWY